MPLIREVLLRFRSEPLLPFSFEPLPYLVKPSILPQTRQSPV